MFIYEDDPLATWGFYSKPTESAAQLHLDEHLTAVQHGGTVLDVGAGSNLSVAASVRVRRPDLRIVSLDPGFEFTLADPTGLEVDLEATMGYFDEEEQALLRADSTWHSNLLPGLAEDIPAADASIDALTSYAASPHYSPNPEQALHEALRVLKVGGLAVHGPMSDEVFAVWDAAIKAAIESGEIADYAHWTEHLVVTNGSEEDPHFTRIVK